MTGGLGQTAIHSASFTDDHALISETIYMASTLSQSVYAYIAVAVRGSTLRDHELDPLSCRHGFGACLSLACSLRRIITFMRKG